MARMEERRSGYNFLVGSLKERDHFEDLGVNRIILKWVLKKQVGRAWTGLIWLRRGTDGGLW